jgi:hypothetical protein
MVGYISNIGRRAELDQNHHDGGNVSSESRKKFVVRCAGAVTATVLLALLDEATTTRR